MLKIKQINSTSQGPRLRKVLSWYFIILTLILISGFLLVRFSTFMQVLGFLGVWTTLFEIIIGLAATSNMSILTSISTIRARGEPLNQTTIIKQRLEEEEISYRKQWFIIFALNTILLFVISYVMFQN